MQGEYDQTPSITEALIDRNLNSIPSWFINSKAAKKRFPLNIRILKQIYNQNGSITMSEINQLTKRVKWDVILILREGGSSLLLEKAAQDIIKKDGDLIIWSYYDSKQRYIKKVNKLF